MSDYKDTFKGTARYYAQYREGYPEAFFALLKDRFDLTGNDRVLDLGCGTGQIAFPLAALAGQVFAVDPEPEMIAEGKRLAEENETENITWLVGSSQNLNRVSEELRNLKLAAIGTAFHWMDREKVLRELYEMILPGGGIVIAANSSIATATDEEWQVKVKTLLTAYLGEKRRAGSGYYEVDPRRHEDFVRESPFGEVELYTLPWERTFSVEALAGYYYSTSMVNPEILGERTHAFEADLKDILNGHFPSGMILYTGKTEVILARKAG